MTQRRMSVALQGSHSSAKITGLPTHLSTSLMSNATSLAGDGLADIRTSPHFGIRDRSIVTCGLRLIPSSSAGRSTFRSEEHTSELQSLMRISYAVFCLKKKNINIQHNMTPIQ